jgi:hypothetical protein
MNPNTRIKTSGNARLNTTDEGLFSIDLIEALVKARNARNWLYGFGAGGTLMKKLLAFFVFVDHTVV